MIYAFCQIDDLSWGTKDANEAKSKMKAKIKEKFLKKKVHFVLKWIFYNFSSGFILVYFMTHTKTLTLYPIMGIVMGVVSIRSFFACLYYIRGILLEILGFNLYLLNASNMVLFF